MATEEQLEYILQELPKAHPVDFFKVLTDSNAGIGFALKLLYSADGQHLSAGDVSEAMGVSTARVAVLLKKMESKGLITKENDKNDARITRVSLSEKGEAVANQMKENMRKHISNVIERLGMEKLKLFIELSVEVKNAMNEDFSQMSEPDNLIRK